MEEVEEMVVASQPLSTMDKKIKEKFAEDIANQGKLMDEVGKLLITVELAIPGVYATVLKLVSGDNAMVEGGLAVGLTFAFWFGALLLTFLAIFPEKYEVDSSRLDTIEAFYHENARRKAKMLMVSVFLFFMGIICSVYAL